MEGKLVGTDEPNGAAIDAAENTAVEVTILPANVGTDAPDDAAVDAAKNAAGGRKRLSVGLRFDAPDGAAGSGGSSSRLKNSSTVE